MRDRRILKFHCHLERLVKQLSNTTFPPESSSSQVPEGSIRLVSNGIETNIGRIEIFKNGEWKSVCAEEWNIAGAEAVCREAGYTTAVDFFL